jgi:hypothetical protein
MHTSTHPRDTRSPATIPRMPHSDDVFVMQMINILAVAGFLLIASSWDTVMLYSSRFDRLPVHTSRLSGQMWLDELLGGHPRRFYNEMGLCKHVFMKLIQILERDAGLVHTRHVSVEEQLAVFLHYVHWGLSNRALQERFQRSADTITKCDVHLRVCKSINR